MDSKNQICKTCLLLCESTLCTFTSVEVPNLPNTTYPLFDVLRMFTDLPVSPSLPEHICKICLDEIQETYFFKLRYDTSLTEQPMDNVTKNTDDFHSEHEHHADTSIGLIKTEKDNEEYEILNEEQIKQEDTTDEFSELVTVKEEIFFVQEVKEEPEIDITDCLNETNPNEKCLQNNLQCTVCTKIFRSEQILKSHMSVHSDFSPFQCKICAKIFRYKFELNTHTKMQHEKFRCRTCSKLFNSKLQLKQHNKRFHIEIRKFKPFRCDFCAAEFENDRNLKQHLQTAHQTQERNLKCTQCPKSFTFISGLNQHMKVHSDAFELNTHTKTEHGMFRCTTCSKLFNSKFQLKQHNKRFHIEMQKFKPFRCDFCAAEFENDRNLKQHLLTAHHTQKKNLKCTQCPKLFEFMSGLNRHMKVHSNAFKLNTHTKPEHEMFRCTTCSKLFNSQLQLKQHNKRFHIEIRKFKPFRCDLCAAEFETDRNLKQHLQIAHQTQKTNLKCTQCPKSFTFMSGLNRHMKVHSDARFQCDICPTEYSSKFNLKAHVKRRHRVCSFCPV